MQKVHMDVWQEETRDSSHIESKHALSTNRKKTEDYLTASGATESDLILKEEGREARGHLPQENSFLHHPTEQHCEREIFYLGHSTASLCSMCGSQTSMRLPCFSFYYCYATQNLNKVPDSLLSFKYAAIIQVVWPMKCKPTIKELVSSMVMGQYHPTGFNF